MKAERMSPSWIFIVLLTLIFCVEEALIYSLDHFSRQEISQLTMAFINAGALTLIMSLFIWWLVMRPLKLALLSEAAMAKAVEDAAADAIITTDEKGLIVSFNPAAGNMFGYAANEVVGKNVAMLMSEPHSGEFRQRITSDKRSEGPGGLPREFTALRKDSTEFSVEISTADTMLGGVRRCITIIRDISERKRMVQAMRVEAAELRLIVDRVPAMIVYYDASLRCRFANRHYADFFGVDAAEITGKHLREIVGDAAYEAAEAEFRKALSGQALSFERLQLLGNGKSVPLEFKLVPHAGESGKILGCYGLLEDISDRKAAEERARRLTNYDSVTGLADRQLLYHCLAQDIAAARRDHHEVALIYLSLAKFKQVNQTLGHHAGDQVLATVGERIRFQARRTDTVARMGGDEFAVVMSSTASRQHAQEAGERIVGALAKPYYLDGKTHAIQIGASIGIAIFPANGQDADSLVKAAYADMEKAK